MTTKSEARALSDRALACLKREFGDTVCLAGGMIGATETIIKFKFQTASKAEVIDHVRGNFNLIAPSLNLLQSDFDLPLMHHGQPCKLVEVSFRSPRYPFIVQLANGKRWKRTADVFLLARMAAAASQSTPVYKLYSLTKRYTWDQFVDICAAKMDVEQPWQKIAAMALGMTHQSLRSYKELNFIPGEWVERIMALPDRVLPPVEPLPPKPTYVSRRKPKETTDA